jgi:hypothetical protein
MGTVVTNKMAIGTEKSQLSKQDIQLLVVLSAEMVNLCARVTRQIDPSMGAMLTYVRDDIISEKKSEFE